MERTRLVGGRTLLLEMRQQLLAVGAAQDIEALAVEFDAAFTRAGGGG